MSYQDTIQYLYASQPVFHLVGAAAYKPGLANTMALMEHLGNPHRCWRSVHVAGTNGKGSVSHLIAASLQCAGLKVGLYTSPHLVDFRERIRINGQMIPEQQVVDFVAANRDLLDDIKPSFFETAMAMAFWYFAKEKVDIAVIEVGLGGRLDSTNIITPLASVITNIGMDHTEFLGDTLDKIAFEKAGIIKPHVPCIIGESHPETDPVFLAKAQQCQLLGEGLETTGCRLWFADQCSFMRRCRERDIRDCQLHGLYQQNNMQTAYVALRALYTYAHLPVTTEAIRQGFAQVCSLTGLRGRWEILSRQPLVICDTGHNSHGIKYVAEQLQQLMHDRPQGHLRMVFGMVNDKDVDVVMRLLPTEGVYYFTQAHTSRAIPAVQMQQMWGRPSFVFPSVSDAVRAALSDARSSASDGAYADDVIFIGGSNYVVGEALTLFP